MSGDGRTVNCWGIFSTSVVRASCCCCCVLAGCSVTGNAGVDTLRTGTSSNWDDLSVVALVTTVQPTTALSQSHTDPATSLHSSLITDKSICYSVNMTATHECGSDNELRGVCLSVCLCSKFWKPWPRKQSCRIGFWKPRSSGSVVYVLKDDKFSHDTDRESDVMNRQIELL